VQIKPSPDQRAQAFAQRLKSQPNAAGVKGKPIAKKTQYSPWALFEVPLVGAQ